jgi:hypothetical protein
MEGVNICYGKLPLNYYPQEKLLGLQEEPPKELKEDNIFSVSFPPHSGHATSFFSAADFCMMSKM